MSVVTPKENLCSTGLNPQSEEMGPRTGEHVCNNNSFLTYASKTRNTKIKNKNPIRDNQ